MPCISNFSSAPKSLLLNVSIAEHRKLIRHLYRRIGYGASLADIQNADGEYLSVLVDNIINTAKSRSLPTYTENGQQKQMFDWQHRPMQMKDVNGKNVTSQVANTNQIGNYWINEAILESVRSKLMLFWHGHFVIQEPVYSVSYAVLRYYNILFDNAFGNFKEFVKAIGRTPLMLIYLNGTENTGHPYGNYESGGGPNENYARELLELFTMGEYYKGSQNYTPDDIHHLARALTGWSRGDHSDFTDIPTINQFRFKYKSHDWGTDTNTNKTLFGQTYLGKTFWDEVFNGSKPIPTNAGSIGIVGNPDANPLTQNDKYVLAGDKEYDKVHDIIFTERKDAIAYFICKKLYEYYIYGNTENQDFQALRDTNGKSVEDFIDDLASTFSSNWDITSVLKQLFKSQHFYDEGVMSAQIKSPVGCAVSFFHIADLKADKDNNGNAITDFDYTYQFTLMPSDYEDDPSPIANYTPAHPSYKPNYNNGKIRAMTGENALPADVLYEYKETFIKQDVMEINRRCLEMGQQIFNPPNVAGWPGHRDWINEYTLTRRWEMLAHFMTKFSPVTKDKFRLLAVKLMAEDPVTVTNPVAGELMVRSVWRHFFCVEPTDRQVMNAIVAYKGGWNYGGVPNINGYDNQDPNFPTTTEVNTQFMKMLDYMIRQPEYQLT